MIDRRQFAVSAFSTLSAVSLSSVALAAAPADTVELSQQLSAELKLMGDAADPDRLARSEQFWERVRGAYLLNSDVINLDHGWTNPTTRAALDELVSGATALEALPAEELGRIFFGSGTAAVRAALAEIMGVNTDEIALVRNATEALNTVLLGKPMQAGDEIVCSSHDYFAMLDALEQRRARDGVTLRIIRPPLRARSHDSLAALYEAAIGPRTRLVLVTSPSNLTGQLYPVRRIAAAAHRVGAEVVVDGAQSLGVHDEPIPALDCDYYGASAHKWLGTPVGLGVLCMRPKHAAKIWPLVTPPPGTVGMRRFEWIGTSPDYLLEASAPALALHRSIGARRKAARLSYLSSYLRKRLSDAIPGIKFYTTSDPTMGTGITTIEVPGADPDVLQKRLREDHRILTQSMTGNARAPEISGLRVTPNVYTRLTEVDRLAGAMTFAQLT